MTHSSRWPVSRREGATALASAPSPQTSLGLLYAQWTPISLHHGRTRARPTVSWDLDAYCLE